MKGVVLVVLNVYMCQYFNREVVTSLKQCFILPSAPLIHHRSTPVSMNPNFRNLTKTILLPKHVEPAPCPGIFIQSFPSCNKGILCLLVQSNLLLIISYPFFYCCLLLVASCTCCYQTHGTPTPSMQCCYMLPVRIKHCTWYIHYFRPITYTLLEENNGC
jgi:hypothetical protein